MAVNALRIKLKKNENVPSLIAKACYICGESPKHIYTCWTCKKDVCYQHSRITATSMGNLDHCEKCWSKKIQIENNRYKRKEKK